MKRNEEKYYMNKYYDSVSKHNASRNANDIESKEEKKRKKK